MVLLYFMDGVKYDMMKKHMPYLSSLNALPLQSDFGYSCACHASMYTGRYIEEHGTWFIWKRGENSPYKWINWVPGLKYMNILPLKLALGKITRKLSRNSSYPGVPCLVNLPLKYWPLFELSDDVMWNNPKWKSTIPNMFTILKKHNIPHHVIGLHRGTGPDDVFREEPKVDYKHDQFVYYFIGYTDNMMHTYGKDGREVQEYLTKIDKFIEHTYKKAKGIRPYEDITVIAFSDHGHISLDKPYIDINNYFRPIGKSVNEYIHLIESNYARFWFRNSGEREDVTKVIKQMEKEGKGFVIDEVYQKRYHLQLDPQEQGDLVFYLAAPHEFTKTIWGFGHRVKSGHGFEPILPDHYGIFCSNKPIEANRNFAFLQDILPSIMTQLGISRVGYTLRGQNLIDAE